MVTIKQWQYTIQMNNNEQWTPITMSNTWYTMSNGLQQQDTMNYKINAQCKQ